MLLIKNGRVIDPANNIDNALDIFINQGKIIRVGKNIDPKGISRDSGKFRIIDASGKIIAPGFIDMHTHLREPGQEGKETIATGCRAAAVGGFTALACMPNTNPVNDNKIVTSYIINKALKEGCVRVYPIGAITRGLKGENLSDIGELKTAGVVALSDDGEPVMNAEVMRRALEYVKSFNLTIISHCEDKDLSQSGAMHEGFVSTRLGLPGIPAAAEEVMVARDLILAEMTSSHIHIAHVSTAGSVDLIRRAKAKGIRVTCEVTPHHFTLTDEAVTLFDPNTKVNPPLRSQEDRDALREGLRDGTIDAIATDHAPHDSLAKDIEYTLTANGIVGLETAVSLTLNELVHSNILTINQAIARLSANPARILGLKGGALHEGEDADITVLDLQREFMVKPETFKSKSRNTPFGGWKLNGGPIMTIVAGNIVWEAK
ncbi:MAG: dihydroorotase [Thermodesulfobacteriota bacterium]|jgi:dihydroorotase|nr:MAG: dihydroorotase [Thermodesulfobacteriota bacterium]